MMWIDWPNLLINTDTIALVIAMKTKEGTYKVILATDNGMDESVGHSREFAMEGDMREEFQRIRRLLCGPR